jgi:hypothetical protein
MPVRSDLTSMNAGVVAALADKDDHGDQGDHGKASAPPAARLA